MRDCLVVMHARLCRPAMESLVALDAPKIWICGHTEREIANGAFEWALAHSDYDRYVVVSDDCVVRQPAWEAVRAALDAVGPDQAATGYCQKSHTQWQVNITRGALRGSRPTIDSYEFRDFQEVVSWPEPLVPTWFAGMALTGMTREMWGKYPFGCYVDGDDDPGYSSDYHLGWRLQQDRVPLYAAREGFVYHWREPRDVGEGLQPGDDPVLIGKMKKEVVHHP